MPIQTEDGEFIAHYSNKGLCGLDFPKPSRQGKGTRASAGTPKEIRDWHAVTTEALVLALKGKTAKELPPLDLSAGTSFQQDVWMAMLGIGTGRTLSYGEIAEKIRRPKALRAVGGACGANPIPVLVPCHRVLAAHGKLGGFSSGLEWKRKLLAREGKDFFAGD